MQHIREILANRSRPYYYDDCIVGQILQRTYDRVYLDTLEEIQSWHEDRLLNQLRHILDNRAISHFVQTHKLEGKRWNEDQKDVVRDLIANAEAREAAIGKAREEYGCHEYDQCILCPQGQKLVAEEVWRYAMGGT